MSADFCNYKQNLLKKNNNLTAPGKISKNPSIRYSIWNLVCIFLDILINHQLVWVFIIFFKKNGWACLIQTCNDDIHHNLNKAKELSIFGSWTIWLLNLETDVPTAKKICLVICDPTGFKSWPGFENINFEYFIQ